MSNNIQYYYNKGFICDICKDVKKEGAKIGVIAWWTELNDDIWICSDCIKEMNEVFENKPK